MHERLKTMLVIAAAWLATGPAFAQNERYHFGVQYDLTLVPSANRADVSITIEPRAKENIWMLIFHIDPKRHTGFTGDGQVVANGEYVTWNIPEAGGRLSYQAVVDDRRANGRYDALMTDQFAVFRGDNLFPPARAEIHELAEADATLHVHLPARWSFVAPYPGTKEHVYQIEHAHRQFDRPTGWMAAGHLGVRRERIAGVRVVVAGPMKQGVRRLDLLAQLNWNLPKVRRLIPDMPKRLLVVSAGDPMFRGGLSGPNSLFIHADRPLLSENGSSTLVHELVHVATGIEAEKGSDWIVEGIAEYYSLKLMWRSGTLTKHRYQQAFRKYEEWAKEADRLDVEVARGPVTARAVGIMRALDHEIHRKTNRQKSLDEVVRLLTAAHQKVSWDSLRRTVAEVMGAPADALSEGKLGI